jgi:hypothetical protein
VTLEGLHIKCIQCGAVKTNKWYSGPICQSCYGKNRYANNSNSILAAQDPKRKRHNAKARYKKKRKELLAKSNQYYNLNKDKILKYGKIYYKKNKQLIIQKQNARDKHRMCTDIQFMLKKRIRTRLKTAMRGNYKSGIALEFLGCSVSSLKYYLESKFKPGMSWNNYGSEWEIDHFNPLFKFDLRKTEDLEKVCNYTNLQPLWKGEHYKKSQEERRLK